MIKRGSKIDELLTLIFMLLAIACIVCFFGVPSKHVLCLGLGGAAIVLRIIQYILRFV